MGIVRAGAALRGTGFSYALGMTELETPWAAVDAATPAGWIVGRPYRHDEMAGGQWEQFAYDPSDRPRVGRRTREWIAIANSELSCVLEMARCLRELAAGRPPR